MPLNPTWSVGARSRRNTLALLAAGMFVAACSDRIQPDVSAIDVTGAEYGKDFRLQDSSGQWRTLADYRGKVVMLFFGFTQCPDVCPTAMMQAVEVLKLLGDEAGKVQVLFVSLDPERDTPEILRAYIQNFHPSFQALRGDVELTRKTAEHFKVFYRKAPFAGSYTIEHSAMVYLYDTEGHLRRALRSGITATAQADAVRTLTRGSAAGPA